MKGHPVDIANLEEVRSVLSEALERRLSTGLTVSFISQSLGHRHEFMNQVTDPFTNPASGWMFDTFIELCKGAMCVPRVKVFGASGVKSPMWEMARENPAFLGIGVLDLLKTLRTDRGLSAAQVAENMGVVKSAVQRIEDADNPYMGSLQRYARGLGAIVRFGAVPTWVNGGLREWQ